MSDTHSRLWMRRCAFALAALALGCAFHSSSRLSTSYPAAPRAEQVDVYHGTAVADPYRPLENPDAPATRAWIEAENAVTARWLDAIPERPAIKERLTALWNYERYGVPAVEAGRYVFTRNDGLQNQAVLYAADRIDAAPRVLIDPNLLSRDGTVALAGWELSPDGRLVAYGTSAAGSDWQEWRVLDVESGKDLPDMLRWIKFSPPAWRRDSKGFFYPRYDEPTKGAELVGVNYGQKLFYHAIGARQADDALIYARPDRKEWAFDPAVTDDGRFLVIHAREGTDPRRRILFQDLQAGGEVVELLGAFDAAYSLVGSDGPVLWLRTDKAAPRGRIVAVSTTDAHRDGGPLLREVVPEAGDTLVDASVVGELFVAEYLKDARSVVKLYRLDGSFAREVPLPGPGTAAGFRGKRGDPETFFSFVGFTSPAAIYRLDVTAPETSVFRAPRLLFRPDEYETRQVFYASKDGTRVPMFITLRKGLKLGPDTRAFLYGYGGFNIPITPSFSVMALVWMERGGVYAVPNLRGGGEYGEAWHESGTRARKQNVFDDFIAAAEWLIANGYTSARRLAIHGRSNGGLLVGACLTQRPELFGAALPAVGVMDMLRYQKFTIGWAWTSDYGSSDDPEQFRALIAYSPLHNVRPGVAYPPTLITTGDHDDRVVPGHSFKFAAALQAAQAGPAPILIRIDTRAGHGAGKPTSKLIDEAADQLSFVLGS